MFCYQCQEAAGGMACTVNGICGKKGNTSNLQDLLIYVLKGISLYGENLYKSEQLPENTVILTAGCAKYRYNKLELGDIGGIPRILDAGQCNDSYSLVLIALKLKEVFELDDINDLPISFDIAWYEQKAVTVLLALFHLGVKGIRLGLTLPAFLSPNVVKVLVDNFDIKGVTTPEADINDMLKIEDRDEELVLV